MSKNQIDAVVLMQAFQLAWDTALDSELVTAENVQDAPRELLTACMMAAEGTNSDGDANADAESIAVAAFAAWQATCGELIDAIPPSNAIH